MNGRIPAGVAEACLACVPKSRAGQAYLQSDPLERRAEVVQAWSGYVERRGPPSPQLAKLRRPSPRVPSAFRGRSGPRDGSGPRPQVPEGFVRGNNSAWQRAPPPSPSSIQAAKRSRSLPATSGSPSFRAGDSAASAGLALDRLLVLSQHTLRYTSRSKGGAAPMNPWLSAPTSQHRTGAQ